MERTAQALATSALEGLGVDPAEVVRRECAHVPKVNLGRELAALSDLGDLEGQ